MPQAAQNRLFLDDGPPKAKTFLVDWMNEGIAKV